MVLYSLEASAKRLIGGLAASNVLGRVLLFCYFRCGVIQLTDKTPDMGQDQWDVPLGGIAQQPRTVLGRTHMEVAAADIRFVVSAPDIPEDAAAGIWDALGRDEFPIFEPHKQQMVNVTFSPAGAEQTVEVQQGWLIACADRSSAVTLLPSTVVVQTQAYARYSESLGARVSTVVPLFAKVTGASKVSRLGLRYVNRFRDAGARSPQFWRGLIDSSFAAPLQGGLGDLVVAHQQQIQLKLDGTAWARINSGLLEEPGPVPLFSFLVDMDVFREATLEYSDELVANHLRQLNRTAFALFTNVVADELLDELGPVTEVSGGSKEETEVSS